MNSGERNMMTSSTNDEEDGHREYAMQVASASVLPMVLKASIELGVLEIIAAAGPGALLSPSHIASQLPNCKNPDAPLLLDRMLRLLASSSLLTCSVPDGQVQRLYGLAPVSKYFLPNQDGVSLSPLFNLIQDSLITDVWYQLKGAVLEGGLPFNRVYGMNAAEYVGKDARLRQLFKDSMRDYNSLFMKKIMETYRGFEGLKSLVDVGGGDGSILTTIISHYPTIQGINFDLPPAIQRAPTYPGIQNVAGDMFVSIPKGDAIFMKWILHSWDDKHCFKLLQNCCEALPNNGKVIVVDLVIPETPEASLGVRSSFQFDLFMMNMNPGGKERTERELLSLAKGAGFSGTRLVCCAYNISLVEFHKKM